MTNAPADGDVTGEAGPAAACCTPATHSLSEAEVTTDVETLLAMGNDTRYEALRIIDAADEALCVCEIEPSLDVSQGAVSQALSRLTEADLVTRRKESRWRYYETTPRADRLLRTLDETRVSDDD